MKGETSRLQNALRGAVIVILLGCAVGLFSNRVSGRSVPLVGLWDKDVGVPSPGGEHDPTLGNVEVSLAGAFSHFEGGSIFLDARPAKEFREGHIPGALSFPEEDAREKVGEYLLKAEPGLAIVTYCRGRDCDSSHLLATELRGAGADGVVVFAAGLDGWEDAGYPVVTGSESKKPQMNTDKGIAYERGPALER